MLNFFIYSRNTAFAMTILLVENDHSGLLNTNIQYFNRNFLR